MLLSSIGGYLYQHDQTKTMIILRLGRVCYLQSLHGHQTFQLVQQVQVRQGVQGHQGLQQRQTLHGLPELEIQTHFISRNTYHGILLPLPV